MKEDIVFILNEFTRKFSPLHQIKPSKCSKQETKNVAWTFTRARYSNPRLLTIYFVRIKDSMYNFHGFRVVQSSAYYFAPRVDFYFSTIDFSFIEREIFWIRIERGSCLS